MRGIFDSQGTYGIMRSSGWTGDTLVLEGDANATEGVTRVREKITRVSENEFRALWEQRLDGLWTPYSVERLKRIAR